jgi:ATP-dependent RNA helicase DeaD
VSSQKTSDFAQLGLSDPVLRAVYEIGYETPSPIQAAAIAPLLEGRDLIGQAQTGTGKTAAFALPLLSKLDLSLAQPQILVLTPTRELAIQVAEAMQKYARYLTGFHVLPVYGGQSFALQLRPLRRGIHAVVGTPGRVLDHLRRKTLSLSAVTTAVLDEADEMLRMGFIDDVEEILQHTPSGKQLALFSATMPPSIRKIVARHTREPVEIHIKSETATVATVTQTFWQVSSVNKLDALTRILETEDFDAMVIFVRTKVATTELAERLEARGFSSAPLNGDMNQGTRELTIERLKSNRLDILVATDVAARGLDVNRISHVINYDIPYDAEAYVHRIGRTARAGRTGKAILFIAPRERRMLHTIERATGQRITQMDIPTRGDVADKRAARFKATINDVLENQDLELFRSVITSYQIENELDMTDVAAALAFMAQGERPLVEPKALERDRQRDAADARKKTHHEQRPTERTNQRPERDAKRPDRDAKPRSRKSSSALEPGESQRYRLLVGSQDGAEAKHIVGAIANEAGLDSAFITELRIFEDYSTVVLPLGMPPEIFAHLQKVRVRGKALKLSPELDANSKVADAPPRKRSSESADAASARAKKPKAKHRKGDKSKKKSAPA